MSALLPIAATAQEIEEACGPDPNWACREVFDATASDFLAEAAESLVARGIPIVLILVAAFAAVHFVKRAIGRSLKRVADARVQQRTSAPGAVTDRAGEQLAKRAAQRVDALSVVLGSATAFVIWVLAGFLVLSELGIDLAPLLAGAGVVGLALGFGAQSLVKDFLAGIFILLEDQFAVGDVVDLGEGEAGVVEDLTLRRTRLRSVEGTVWHVGNGEIVRVGNMSQHWARALLDIEVAYATDLDQARSVIKRVADGLAEADDDILEEPEVWGVEALGASGVTIRLVVKTRPSEQWRIMRTLRERIKDAFDAEGIEIPFPQQTVWTRSAPPPGGTGPAP